MTRELLTPCRVKRCSRNGPSLNQLCRVLLVSWDGPSLNQPYRVLLVSWDGPSLNQLYRVLLVSRARRIIEPQADHLLSSTDGVRRKLSTQVLLPVSCCLHRCMALQSTSRPQVCCRRSLR
ncbi:unnamed protein product [Arctogadus glacialis]